MGICAVIATVGWPAAAGETLTARVTPRSGLAPADVVIQAFIERDARNRSVSFEVDSGAFFAHSELELEGERAPRALETRFRMLPSGSYEVCVTLFGTNGYRARYVRTVNLWRDIG